MPRPQPLPSALAGRAFSVREARTAHGLTAGRLRGEDLAAPFHGVRSGEAPSTHLGACLAYAVKLRPRDHLSHQSAAVVHGLPLPRRLQDGPVHVTAALPTGRPRGRGVHGHSAAPQLVRSVVVRGIRVSHPVQVWCELAVSLTPAELVALGDALVRRNRPVATMGDLAAAVQAWRGRRGAAALLRALGLVRPRTDSWEETMLRLDLAAAGLPEPEVNGEIRDAGGRFLALGDLVFRGYRVLAEYDGEQHRTDGRQYGRDVDRLEDLAAAGWRVVRFTRQHRGLARLERIERVRLALRAAGWQVQ